MRRRSWPAETGKRKFPSWLESRPIPTGDEVPDPALVSLPVDGCSGAGHRSFNIAGTIFIGAGAEFAETAGYGIEIKAPAVSRPDPGEVGEAVIRLVGVSFRGWCALDAHIVAGPSFRTVLEAPRVARWTA
jgi:hypothetical protein